jgi:enolase
MKLKDIYSRWVLDSRGNPTIFCQVLITDNKNTYIGSSQVPSGASTGSHEALELRDNNDNFHGKGVNLAIDNINNIIKPVLIYQEFDSPKTVDQIILTLDNTENKSKIGANAILAVSIACHSAFAKSENLELFQYLRNLYFSTLSKTYSSPLLMCNLINGGAHADNGLSIQEIMLIPKSKDIQHNVQMVAEIYQSLKINLKKQNLTTLVGDEGGFAPKLSGLDEALQLVKNAATSSNYEESEFKLAIDAAATEFFNKSSELYTIDNQELNSEQLVNFYEEINAKFNLESIEDGLSEDDVNGWRIFKEKLGDKLMQVGDDLFVTNKIRFQKLAVELNLANAILIKPNQIGSLLETCEVINLAKEHNYKVIISHRSGETSDTLISDLAYACNSEYIKLGAPARGERVAKYNRLLVIHDKVVNNIH